MTEEYYPLGTNDGLYYEFESISPKSKIKKIISFTPFKNDTDIYNLALGDQLNDGTISDLSISNNFDMIKVMATVVKSLCLFFEKYPNKFVFFKGSTVERTRLYRIIISRELKYAKKMFVVYGQIENQIEYFQPNKNYTAFIISLNNKDEN